MEGENLQKGGLSHKSYSLKCLQEKMGSVNFHLCLSLPKGSGHDGNKNGLLSITDETLSIGNIPGQSLMQSSELPLNIC